MAEPFFEERRIADGEINYPFSCHISENNNRDFFIDPHWHYYIELLYSLSGRAKVFTGGSCYEISEGDFIIINAREVHSISADKNTCTRYIVVKFDPQVLYTSANSIFDCKYVLPFTIAKSNHQKVFYSIEIQDTPVPELMRNIYTEYTGRNYGFELAMKTDICRLFLWILRNWQSKGMKMDVGEALNELHLRRLQGVLDYLDENYRYDVSMDKAAQMCGMSYSYFSRRFKSAIGRSFIEYLNYIRVTEAEKLLTSTDLNITQVALQTGFSDSNYFIRQFRNFRNISPKQFRKSVMNQLLHD